MRACNIRKKRELQLFQRIKQIIKELTDTTAAICIYQAIKDNVSTTQLNHIFIDLTNKGGKNGKIQVNG